MRTQIYGTGVDLDDFAFRLLFNRGFGKSTGLDCCESLSLNHVRLKFQETDKEYIYTADLVGLDKDKLHLKIEGLKATLSYDNPDDKRRQKFEYRFALPEIADTETVYTSYEKGELKIVIDKLKRKIKEYTF